MLASLKRIDSRLWILIIGWFTSSVGFSLSIPFISIYFHSELKLSLAEIGIFFGVAGIVRSISHSFGGELSDRIGRYHIMVAAQLLRSITFLFVAYAIYAHWSFWGIGSIIIINFIFGSFFQPAANAAVADLVDVNHRTEGYAIVRSAENLGWATGPAIGGFIAGRILFDSLRYLLGHGVRIGGNYRPFNEEHKTRRASGREIRMAGLIYSQRK